MTTVEIPTHVCHILDTHYCGPEAILGHDCPDMPIWDPLGCVPVDLAALACAPQSLTLSPAVPVSLPAVPLREEAP